MTSGWHPAVPFVARALFARLDLTGRVLGIEAIGHVREEARGLLGARLVERVHVGDRDTVHEAIEQLRRDERRRASFEARLQGIGGWAWFEWMLTSDAQGRVRAVARDASEVHALRDVARALFDESEVPCAHLSADGVVVRANEPLAALLGVDGASVVGKPLAEMESELGDRGVRRFRRPDGQTRLVRMTTSVLNDAGGRPAGCLAQLVDVTRERAAEGRLAEEALRDPLTGLPRRPGAEARLASRGAGRGAGVLLHVDLDGFRRINDALGRAAGDDLLLAVARRLTAAHGPHVFIARLEGDEFCAVCPDIYGRAGAVEAARRVRDALARPVWIEGMEVLVRATVGVVLCPPNAAPAGLLRDAEVAMAEGKRRLIGVCVFEPAMRERGGKALAVARELRRGIGAGELRLVFQPEVDAATGVVTGLEALVRWSHPQRGELAPAEFLDIAAEVGLMGELGAWVVREACASARRWQDRFGKAPQVAINISPAELATGEVSSWFARGLAEHDLGGRALCLEVTEHGALDLIGAADELRRVRALGTSVALDDFGTGHATLTALRALPVDSLKIDGSFVGGLGAHRQDEAIVGAVIDLAHACGARAVAEGVETADQLRHLRDAGCDVVQGFHLAAPLPAPAVDALLAAPAA